MATVRGLDEFSRNLERLSRATQGKALGQAVLTGGQEIVNEAKSNILSQGLVQTGNLRRSMDIELIEASSERATAQIGTNLIYAAIHEFGGEIRPVNARALVFEIDGKTVVTQLVRMPARPYLRPAFESGREAAVANFRAALADLIREALR